MSTEDEGQTALPLGDALPAVIEDKDEEPKWEMDWSKSEDVVIEDQRPIAVYTNTRKGIVIRAEKADYEDDDAVIVLSTVGAAHRVIEAIQRELEALKAELKQ